jgi:predicted P-loop ATPase
MTTRQQIEEYLTERFLFRYNTIKSKVEYITVKDNELKKRYLPISDRFLHNIMRSIDADTKIKTSSMQIYSVLMSNFTTEFNPIIEYFNYLQLKFKPKHFNPDALEIEKLAMQLSCTTIEAQKSWHKVLIKWMIASVANSLTLEGCQNHSCIVLTGGQGAFKTTYLNFLCPPFLKDYIYTGKLVLDNKDTWLMLGTNFIINIDDQLKNLFKKDAETMKTLITQPDLELRFPHDKLTTRIQRIANFCGSINGSEFLADQTGNRRFLPFEVKSIDIDYVQTKIDIDKCWFESYTLFKDNFKYWFDKTELEELFGDFENFYSISPEQEFFCKYFEPLLKPESKDHRFKLLSTSEIMQFLNVRSNGFNMNLKKLGELLTKMKIIKGAKTGGIKGYYVRLRDQIEFDEETETEPIF